MIGHVSGERSLTIMFISTKRANDIISEHLNGQSFQTETVNSKTSVSFC